MRTLLFFFFASIIFLLSACNKEDKIYENLKGSWIISEVRFSQDSLWDVNNKFNTEIHGLEFLSCEKPYTTSCPCIYKIDYSSESFVDLADTFYYELKGNEFNVGRAKNNIVRKVMQHRFRIEAYEGSELFLNREGLDTIKASLKAIRN